jgi:hypothetical protein
MRFRPAKVTDVIRLTRPNLKQGRARRDPQTMSSRAKSRDLVFAQSLRTED